MPQIDDGGRFPYTALLICNGDDFGLCHEFFSSLFVLACLIAGQDFFFFLFSKLSRSLERLCPAVVVMDVETLGTPFVSPGCSKYAEAGDFLPAAGALESLRNTVDPGCVRFHWRYDKGKILDLMLTDIFVAMFNGCLQRRFTAAKYAVAEELAIHFAAMVNAQEPAVGAATVHAADAFPFVRSICSHRYISLFSFCSLYGHARAFHA